MARPTRLEPDEIETRLAKLRGWTIEAGKLHREYRFADFNAAFAFMTRVAMVAERMDHHPEWCNVYASVRVDLTTHDAGGISHLDFELAAKMDAFAAEAG